MELTEPVDAINKQLHELFGDDLISGQPIWRVVWSEDQFEHRYGTYDDYTPGGIFLRTFTGVRYVPKYRQWIQKKYVLERLVAVPEINKDDLPNTKISYEPLWVFEDKYGNALPPHIEASKFIINTVLAAQHRTGNLRKYDDPESTHEKALEEKRKRVDAIVEELFGDQSEFAGTTKTGETVIVPQNYEKKE